MRYGTALGMGLAIVAACGPARGAGADTTGGLRVGAVPLPGSSGAAAALRLEAPSPGGAVVTPRPAVVERYAAPRVGYYKLWKPVGNVMVTQVLIGRAGRTPDGEAWWRIGMGVRNLTREWQAPRITLVFFQGERVLGTLTMYDGGFPLGPARSGWQSILVPIPRGVAPDGFAVLVP